MSMMNPLALSPSEKAAEAAVQASGHDPDREIAYYSRWAAGAGLLPTPVVDLAAVAAVQVKMVKRLARAYNVDFDEGTNGVKSLVGAVLGAGVPARIGYGGIGSLIKAVPVIGPVLGAATMPGFNYASTWALGQVFKKHFAHGGTLADANVKQMGAAVSEAQKAAPVQ